MVRSSRTVIAMHETEAVSGYLPRFLFILLRTGLFFSMTPFFGSRNFPLQFKIGLVGAIALVLTPVVQLGIEGADIPALVLNETIFSIVLGLSVRAVFMAVEMAGQIMSNSMGLSIATVFNPEMGQSTEVARLQGIIAMLLFLATDAHHDLIAIFVKSYEVLPAGHIAVRNLMTEGTSIIGRVFVMALKIAAPVTLGMVIANLLLGFLSRTAPQMNIFFVAFPVYIALGLLIMIVCVPVFAGVMRDYFGDIGTEMSRIIGIAKG